MPFLLLLAVLAPLGSAKFDGARRHAPADVRALLDRWEGCHHWSGEEAYDRQRGRQIDHALHGLHCDRLPRDVAALRRRHAAQAPVQRLIVTAHGLFD